MNRPLPRVLILIRGAGGLDLAQEHPQPSTARLSMALGTQPTAPLGLV